MIERALRSAIARVALLHRLVKSPLGQQLVQTARGAGVVRERLRFTARQLGPSRTGGYRLRGSGLRIFLRHENVLSASRRTEPSTGDVHILNEIFGGTGGQCAYDPPPELVAAFDARPPSKVMDLGGNIGLFGVDALGRWPGARIESFEPDRANLRMLTRVVATNGVQDRWSVADAAAANHAGEMTFVTGLFAESHLADAADAADAAVADDDAADDAAGAADGAEGEGAAGGADAGTRAVTVRTVDLFEQDHDVDLMKMDIEGGEWSILTDARLPSLKADVIVLEWHARGCPEPNARAAAARLLRGAGYGRIEEVEVATHNGVLWAWRENNVGG